MTNLFALPMPFTSDDERVDTLHAGEGIRIERIASRGHRTPEGEWYDQREGEWVVLLEGDATILYDSGDTVELRRGDCLYFPPNCRHRVERTSVEPACVWLAVFFACES